MCNPRAVLLFFIHLSTHHVIPNLMGLVVVFKRISGTSKVMESVVKCLGNLFLNNLFYNTSNLQNFDLRRLAVGHSTS